MRAPLKRLFGWLKKLVASYKAWLEAQEKKQNDPEARHSRLFRFLARPLILLGLHTVTILTMYDFAVTWKLIRAKCTFQVKGYERHLNPGLHFILAIVNPEYLLAHDPNTLAGLEMVLRHRIAYSYLLPHILPLWGQMLLGAVITGLVLWFMYSFWWSTRRGNYWWRATVVGLCLVGL